MVRALAAWRSKRGILDRLRQAAKFRSLQLMTSFVRLAKVVVDNGAVNFYLREDTPTERSTGGGNDDGQSRSRSGRSTAPCA